MTPMRWQMGGSSHWSESEPESLSIALSFNKPGSNLVTIILKYKAKKNYQTVYEWKETQETIKKKKVEYHKKNFLKQTCTKGSNKSI